MTVKMVQRERSALLFTGSRGENPAGLKLAAGNVFSHIEKSGGYLVGYML